MTYALETETALKAVTRAARLCLAVQADLVQVDSLEKGDRSPVTIADFGSQALVCQMLKTTFPDAIIVAEEDSAQLQTPENGDRLAQVVHYVRQVQPDASPQQVCGWIDTGNGQVANRFWTLDPIDGTKGFLRNEQYAVALALIEAGQVQVAALACPALPYNLDDPHSKVGLLFVAVRRQGAMVAPLGGDRFEPIHVAEVSNQAKLRFVESVEASHSNLALQKTIAAAVGITAPAVQMDSQAKYGVVARGEAALYLRLPSPKSPNYREKIWDHAAGSLLVEEAGGRVTDMHGLPLDFVSDYKMERNRGVIVSSGDIHAKVLEAVAAIQEY